MRYPTNRPTDQPTNQPTDTAYYRGASAHLKRMACILLRPLEKGVAVVTVDVVVRMDDCVDGAVLAGLVVVGKGRYFDGYAI